MSFETSWIGECSAWECDDLGHLNMRFYMAKVRQARQMFFIRSGLTLAFTPQSPSSVRVRDYHIKYHGEARPGDPLRIETALLDMSTGEAQLCHMMYHSDGRLAASIVETVEHYYRRSNAVFQWPRRFITASNNKSTELPDRAKARHIDKAVPSTRMTREALIALNVDRIGLGVFRSDELGSARRVTAKSFLGRITESVATFENGWPELHNRDNHKEGRSGALLEAYCRINRFVGEGTAYEIYSAVISADTYVRRIVHNIVDVTSGENLFSMDAVGCLFDLKARKLIKATPEEVATLEALAIPEVNA